jgi:hypothetical protein
LDIRISNPPYIHRCESLATETGLKSRNVEKRINLRISDDFIDKLQKGYNEDPFYKARRSSPGRRCERQRLHWRGHWLEPGENPPGGFTPRAWANNKANNLGLLRVMNGDAGREVAQSQKLDVREPPPRRPVNFAQSL